MTTIREILNSMGGLERVVVKGYDYALDEPVANWGLCSSPETGSLQINCGGEAIMSFTVSTRKGPFFLVREDDDGRKWDRLKQSGVPFHKMKDYDLPHYRPHARLRLVHSG